MVFSYHKLIEGGLLFRLCRLYLNYIYERKLDIYVLWYFFVFAKGRSADLSDGKVCSYK